MSNRLTLLFQFLLICAVVCLKLCADSSYFLTPDAHYYLQAAQNLLNGKGYLITFEGKETFCAIWPIGYSALIAGVTWLTAFSPEIASKIVNILALAGCFWLILRRFQEKAWFVAMGLMASSLIQLYTNTWSETLFLLFVLGFCTVSFPKNSGFFWTIGAFLARYAGVFLLIPLLLRRQYSTVVYALLFIASYLLFNFSQTHTFTGGHGFWPEEDWGSRCWRAIKGLGEEFLFFAMRDWDLKNDRLPNLIKWLIYGAALLQFFITALVIRSIIFFLLEKRKVSTQVIPIKTAVFRIIHQPFVLVGGSYLLFTMIVYLTDASIESLYFRRLAPSSLLFTLAILGWVAQQKVIFERTKWLFVAFFVLSIIHAIPKQ